MELDTRMGTGSGQPGMVSPNVADNTVYLTMDYVKVGQKVFEVEEPSARNGFTRTIKAGICKGCEDIFQSANAARTSCCRCHYVMCSECKEQKRCAICRRPVCPDCGGEDGLTEEWHCNECY